MQKIQCEQFSQRVLKNGKANYYQSALMPVIVQPGNEHVVSLEPPAKARGYCVGKLSRSSYSWRERPKAVFARFRKFRIKVNGLDRYGGAGATTQEEQAGHDLVAPECNVVLIKSKEFAAYQHISQALSVDFYFAHPYSSWERGTNENTNGLIRQYFRKSRSLKDLSVQEEIMIMDRLNLRPRKRLDFITTYEVFFGHYSAALVT